MAPVIVATATGTSAGSNTLSATISVPAGGAGLFAFTYAMGVSGNQPTVGSISTTGLVWDVPESSATNNLGGANSEFEVVDTRYCNAFATSGSKLVTVNLNAVADSAGLIVIAVTGIGNKTKPWNPNVNCNKSRFQVPGSPATPSVTGWSTSGNNSLALFFLAYDSNAAFPSPPASWAVAVNGNTTAGAVLGALSFGLATRTLATPQSNATVTWSSGVTGVHIFDNLDAIAGPSELQTTIGSYAITGRSAAIDLTRVLQGAPGSYAITGQAAALIASEMLQGAPGSYAITGQAAALNLTRVLQGAPGSYGIVGEPAAIDLTRVLQGAPGAYVLDGESAALNLTRVLQGAPGAYVLDGEPAALSLTWSMPTEAGSYFQSGHPAALITVRVLSGDSGIYSINGQPGAAKIFRANINIGERHGGGGIPPKDRLIDPAELELFRGKMYGRGIDALVPPVHVAYRNLGKRK